MSSKVQQFSKEIIGERVVWVLGQQLRLFDWMEWSNGHLWQNSSPPLTSFLIHWSEAIRALSNLVDMIYYEDIGVQRYTQENLNKYSVPWRRAGGSTATGQWLWLLLSCDPTFHDSSAGAASSSAGAAGEWIFFICSLFFFSLLFWQFSDE